VSKSKRKKMQWEVRKIKEGGSKGKWGVFLKQEFCKTDEPVCYGAAHTKAGAQSTVDRLNNPVYDEEV
tara:strand:- start:238 stop:441 length:204 start_codon:yes stop_codon:yes gene_type:complete